MNSLIRSITFYLVAWLCLSNVLFCFVNAKPQSCFAQVGRITTYTQVEIGTPGTPAANLLSQHWSEICPKGLVIGANVVLDLVTNLLTCPLPTIGGILGGLLGTTLNIVFSTCDAVIAFLPQNAIPSCLTSYAHNPTSSVGGLLAGETVTAAVNVLLDAHLSNANVDLAALVFVQGPCAGLSVGAVLNIANAVLGQKCDATLVSLHAPLTVAANLYQCLSTCNTNFFDGIRADVNLALPGLCVQALVDLDLPINIDVNAAVAVKAVISAPVNIAARVYLNAQLLNIAAGLSVAANVNYNCFRLDAIDISLNADLAVSALVVAVPSKITGVVGSLTTIAPTVIVDDLLCLVNYLLNFCPPTVSGVNLQAAIFLLLNPTWVFADLAVKVPWLTGCDKNIVVALVADVRINGIHFIPAPGQIVGLVATVKVNVAGVAVDARILLQLTIPKIDVTVKTDLCIGI